MEFESFWRTILLVNTALVLFISAYFLLRKDPRLKYQLNKLGGPPTLPVLGNALQLLVPHNELLTVLENWFKEYGTTLRFWVGNIVPYVITCDACVIEKVISGTAYLDKGKHDYSLFDEWLGTGLLTAPGSKWSARRKLLTPSFHFKILEDFIPVFNEQASVFLSCLERDVRGNGEVFNMYPYITKCTLDIICETAMGLKTYAQTSNSNKNYFDAVNGMCALILDKNMKPWLRIPIIYKLTSMSKKERDYLKIIKGFTEEVIKARKTERKLGEHGNPSSMRTSDNDGGIYGKKRKAFLDLLLDVADETHQLTDTDIREEVDTFMFEGHDTTAVNLAWTVLLLAMHPEHQQLVHKELDEVFADNPTGDLTVVDISKLKYLECCVKESLRIFPSVPFIMRQMNTDLCLDDGRVIPKGSTVMMAIFSLHRQPENFSDPENFLPERWSSESMASTKKHPYSYIPFSAGPRNCIGQKFALMEEKIVLAKLFRKYTITTMEKMENLVPLPDVILRCQNGVNVSLQER